MKNAPNLLGNSSKTCPRKKIAVDYGTGGAQHFIIQMNIIIIIIILALNA
jgi:hypothetical protein